MGGALHRITIMLLLAILVVHGLIHAMGFLHAFQIVEMDEFNQNISEPISVVWPMLALLFLSLVIFITSNKDWWWMPAIITIIPSQLLIFQSWQDAKFGTIVNVILLIATCLQYAVWNFNRQTSKEICTSLSMSKSSEKTIITEQMISTLPFPVQNWLSRIGVIGRETITNVYVKQTGQMKLKPGQKNWYNVEAEQHITIEQPAFLWKVKMSILPLLNVFGRDLFVNGEGSIKMNLAAILPIVKQANNEKINESALQRFLLELPWYPTMALHPNLVWESNSNNSATATLSYHGVTGSATYFFDDEGDLIKCSAFRYKDNDENAKRLECIGEVKKINSVDGIKIPVQMDVSWMLDSGKFTWYKITIQDLAYNRNKYE